MENCCKLLAFWLLMVTVSASEMRVKRQTMANGIIDPNCLKCICKLETGCKPVGCRGSGNSMKCGYFQLNVATWKVCGSPGGSLKVCGNHLTCASGCVQNFIKKYIGSSGCPRNCEGYARIFNGGPQGCKQTRTMGYWNKIKNCLKIKG